VVEVSPRLNRAKATGTVKVRLTDPGEGVLPEMSARVSFLAKALAEAEMKEPPKKVIPASAVVERSGAKVVFALDGDKVHVQTVTLGPPFGGGFELKTGPEQGTKIVKNPPPTLVDGQDVKQRSP
jgi:hypothetical protein